jgi:hypothetical protein
MEMNNCLNTVDTLDMVGPICDLAMGVEKSLPLQPHK